MFYIKNINIKLFVNHLDGVSARFGGVVARLGGRCRAVRTAQYATLPAGGVMHGSNRANTPKMAASINCRPSPLTRPTGRTPGVYSTR